MKNLIPLIAFGAMMLPAACGRLKVLSLLASMDARPHGRHWTRKSGGVSELLVRGYVNARRQMAVCTFLHTKGDGITAGLKGD